MSPSDRRSHAACGSLVHAYCLLPITARYVPHSLLRRRGRKDELENLLRPVLQREFDAPSTPVIVHKRLRSGCQKRSEAVSQGVVTVRRVCVLRGVNRCHMALGLAVISTML